MLVLASASPRRRELLAQAGFSFEVHPAHIPEEPLEGEDPIAYVTRLAREKAEAVFRELTAAKEQTAKRNGWTASYPRGAGRRYHGHARQPHSGQAGRCSRRGAHVAAALRAHASRDHRRGAGDGGAAPKLPPKPRRFAFLPCRTRKLRRMWRPASPWTRPAPTLFRAGGALDSAHRGLLLQRGGTAAGAGVRAAGIAHPVDANVSVIAHWCESAPIVERLLP